MVIGDVVESAAWVSGPADLLKADETLTAVLDLAEQENGVKLGRRKWELLDYGDERVPTPPRPGMRLRYVSARVEHAHQMLGFNPHDLPKHELEALRAITRRLYAEQRKRLGVIEPPLTDQQVDTLISQIAPQTIEKRIAHAVKAH
jgi:hypothetical protein